jgi:hypothetical protein
MVGVHKSQGRSRGGATVTVGVHNNSGGIAGGVGVGAAVSVCVDSRQGVPQQKHNRRDTHYTLCCATQLSCMQQYCCS